MVDLIFPLLQEMDTIPTKVLDVIFTNIIEPRKTQEREANKLARDLIQRSENCLEPYIQAVMTPFSPQIRMGYKI